ncbi:MAG TPA: phosphate ABC transporter permease PstA [Acidimicrobiales bacterium]|nr:phosphate ABC transporter permease PstA [Acidimicrobiales bacterium]
MLRRKAGNWTLWGACAIALALVVIPVVWILEGVVSKALAHWHWSVLTTTTVGQAGGLGNAIVGTLLIVFGVAIIAGVVGIAGGVYLAEFTSERRGSFLRGASEVLAGIPSIVLGYVGYITLVLAFHWGFSLAAALIVLSIMVVPYITKSTEVALRSVPTAYREGGEALGMTSSVTLRKLVMKPALPGIATGLIVALAIALGETAPLLYTAGWSAKYPSLALTHSPVGYLPYAVYSFYNYPYASSKQLSNLAALLLIVLVLFLIVVARIIVSVTQRHAPDRPQRVERTRKLPFIDVFGAPFRTDRLQRFRKQAPQRATRPPPS